MAAYPPVDRTDHPQIAHNPIEEEVPNEAKTLPTSRNNVFLICGIVAVLMIVAITLSFGAGAELIGFILTLAAVGLGVLAILMARGDARVSVTTPVVATICAAALAVVIGLDLAEADDVLEGQRGPGAVTIGGAPANIPEDPADLAKPAGAKTPADAD
jgi:hypothetical protein